MKTIQISDELWKALRVEAAQRGVTMRQVVEEMGEAARSADVTEAAMRGQGVHDVRESLRRQMASVPRELKVELEE